MRKRLHYSREIAFEMSRLRKTWYQYHNYDILTKEFLIILAAVSLDHVVWGCKKYWSMSFSTYYVLLLYVAVNIQCWLCNSIITYAEDLILVSSKIPVFYVYRTSLHTFVLIWNQNFVSFKCVCIKVFVWRVY